MREPFTIGSGHPACADRAAWRLTIADRARTKHELSTAPTGPCAENLSESVAAGAVKITETAVSSGGITGRRGEGISAEMKVLIIAFWFPPSNSVGAIRVGKLARYLYRRGYQVRVLTTDISEDRSLPLEIPRDQVIYTNYRERAPWSDFLVQLFRPLQAARRPTSGEVPRGQGRPLPASFWDKLRPHYHGLINIPDLRSGWIKTAVPVGRRLIEDWKPDIIFASAPPFTGLVVAGRLSRGFNIPWVADYRDLWADYSYTVWRRPIDRIIERLTLRNASALVTTSPYHAQQLDERHHRRVVVVFNGYDEEDFPETPAADVTPGLTIRYTGSIYGGSRDPSPLFAAIAMLEGGLRREIRVEFFCDSGADVTGLAAVHGIADRIVVRPRVPHQTALALQLHADALLLLQWNNKHDRGNIPAKLFEYLYARRPILAIGYEQGIAAQLLRERDAGLVSNVPERIRDQLRTWIEQKRVGCLKRLDPSVSRGLSRDEQFRKLEQVFAEILHEQPGRS